MARCVAGVTLLCCLLVAEPAVAAVAPCPSLPVVQQTTATHSDEVVRTGLTIASLNIAASSRIGGAVESWIEERDIDILLLQEVPHPALEEDGMLAGLGRRLGLHVAYAPAYSSAEGPRQGLAIMSRYPLADVRAQSLAHHRLRFRSRCRIALAATVMAREGPISVVNVHLDTRVNSKLRLAQLAPLIETRTEVAIPQILGGDFNTMNIRWLASMWPLPYLQRQAAALRAMLESEGFHTPLVGGPPTFRILGIVPLRLDWIYLKSLAPLDWGVDRVPITDHRGVWVHAGMP